MTRWMDTMTLDDLVLPPGFLREAEIKGYYSRAALAETAEASDSADQIITLTWAPPAVVDDPRRHRLNIPNVVRTGTRVAYLDLDGVICNDTHRVHHAKARDWGAYFSLMTEDTPWRQGRELYESCILAGWDIAYLTGRREDTRAWTLSWLKQHDFDDTLPLVMRPQELRMPLANLKAAVVTETLRFVPEVLLCDDDPEVIAAVSKVEGAQVKHCTWHIKDKALVKKAQF